MADEARSLAQQGVQGAERAGETMHSVLDSSEDLASHATQLAELVTRFKTTSV